MNMNTAWDVLWGHSLIMVIIMVIVCMIVNHTIIFHYAHCNFSLMSNIKLLCFRLCIVHFGALLYPYAAITLRPVHSDCMLLRCHPVNLTIYISLYIYIIWSFDYISIISVKKVDDGTSLTTIPNNVIHWLVRSLIYSQQWWSWTLFIGVYNYCIHYVYNIWYTLYYTCMHTPVIVGYYLLVYITCQLINIMLNIAFN